MMDEIYLEGIEFPNGIEMLDGAPVDTTLSGLTTIFWRISFAYNRPNQTTDSISVEQANRKCNLISRTISDTRLLWRRTQQLQWAIIEGSEVDDIKMSIET